MPSCHPTNSVKSLMEFKSLIKNILSWSTSRLQMDGMPQPSQQLSDTIIYASISLRKQRFTASKRAAHYGHFPLWQ